MKLEMNSLVGRKVNSALINEEKDLVIFETDKGPLYLIWTGDCCAQCYLANVSGIDFLIGATILEAQNAEWKNCKEDEYEVVESMGTKIKTNKGYVSFESRVKHNGYYSGRINISDDFPRDQYDYKMDIPKNMKPLKDF